MNILLIYGGKSCEHDISIITACLAKGYFNGNLYSAYLDKQNRCFLLSNNLTPSKHLDAPFKHGVNFLLGEGKIEIVKGKFNRKQVKIDVAVNCCHGVNGEDGSVAGLCQLANIPLVGSNLLSSSVAMNKIVTKKMLRSIGLPVLTGKKITKKQYLDGKYTVGNMSYSVIVKPANLGSSIGVGVCHNKSQLKSALENAFAYDDEVLCEKALTNFYEVNCSVMRVKDKVVTSDVDNPATTNDILTFQDKYLQNAKWCKPTSKVDGDVVNLVKQLSAKIYCQLGFSGVIRVDFLVQKDTGKVYVNEINAIPGSLAYGLWERKYSATQFGNLLIDQAINDFRHKNSIVHTFDSTVLDGKIRKK